MTDDAAVEELVQYCMPVGRSLLSWLGFAPTDPRDQLRCIEFASHLSFTLALEEDIVVPWLAALTALSNEVAGAPSMRSLAHQMLTEEKRHASEAELLLGEMSWIEPASGAEQLAIALKELATDCGFEPGIAQKVLALTSESLLSTYLHVTPELAEQTRAEAFLGMHAADEHRHSLTAQRWLALSLHAGAVRRAVLGLDSDLDIGPIIGRAVRAFSDASLGVLSTSLSRYGFAPPISTARRAGEHAVSLGETISAAFGGSPAAQLGFTAELATNVADEALRAGSMTELA